ncbi:MAG: Asp-tRNA(Asn)/Glu-tRNA(Gln) amidotransferase subunit GatC [Candidatus Saccharibacteria bacterium]
MALTIKEVEHVAMLGRLTLTAEEKELYAQQLSAILEFAEILNKLPTDDVEPLAHVLPVFNVMRDDEQRPSFTREDVLSNAPEQEDGLFKVPRIV